MEISPFKVLTAQCLERIPTSEAVVEQVSSRRKLVHSQIRASLKDEENSNTSEANVFLQTVP